MPLETVTMKQRDAGTPVVRKPFVLTGRHVLACMIAFFAVVAGVNGVMMRVAIGTMPGLDARNGYDVSQLYNGEIAAAAAQAQRGWTLQAGVERRQFGAMVLADLASSASGPIAGATVRATLEHPATRQLDRTLVLTETHTGHYEALAVGLPPGTWTLVLRVEQGDPGVASPGRPAFVSRNRIRVEG